MKTKKYTSRYSSGKQITPAQYIAEIICENKARQDKIELPQKFWNLESWRQYYVYQVGLANKLLKKYNDVTIVKAIRNCRDSTSLQNVYLKKEIAKQQKALKKIEASPTIAPMAETWYSEQPKQSGLRELLDV